MISHVQVKHEWMMSYRFMRMNMSGIIAGNKLEKQSDVLNTYAVSPDFMQMNMHMAMMMYGLSSRLTVMAMLNYNTSYMEMTMPTGKSYHHHPMSSSGLGDARAYALYALLKSPAYQLLVCGGVSVPTGNINVMGGQGATMYPGQRYPYAMQPGSGTYDFLPCLNYLVQKRKFTFSTQLSSVLRTGYNRIGYRLGDEVNLCGWGAWQWASLINSSVRLNANVAGKMKGMDPTLNALEELSANTRNYGGTRIYAYAGSSIQPGRGPLKKHCLALEWGMPLYQRLNGIQMKQKFSINVNWSIRF
jgi:hypothetical protein